MDPMPWLNKTPVTKQKPRRAFPGGPEVAQTGGRSVGGWAGAPVTIEVFWVSRRRFAWTVGGVGGRAERMMRESATCITFCSDDLNSKLVE